MFNEFVDLCLHRKKAYQKTRTHHPIEALVGPYKNWKTGTQDPSGALAGPYKNPENRDPNENLRKSKKRDTMVP